jgi:hypothetical protein
MSAIDQARQEAGSQESIMEELRLDPYSEQDIALALRLLRLEQAIVRRREPTKQCRKCGVVSPRTAEHYYRDPCRRDGLRVVCKQCESQRKPRTAGYKRCGRCRRMLPASRNYFYRQGAYLDAWCIECHRSYDRDRSKQNSTC